jgi:hypothetical protein
MAAIVQYLHGDTKASQQHASFRLKIDRLSTYIKSSSSYNILETSQLEAYYLRGL